MPPYYRRRTRRNRSIRSRLRLTRPRLSRLSRLSARVMAGAGARVLIREGAGAPAPSILTNISSVRFDKVFA